MGPVPNMTISQSPKSGAVPVSTNQIEAELRELIETERKITLTSAAADTRLKLIMKWLKISNCAILSVRIPVIPRGQTVRPYRPIS